MTSSTTRTAFSGGSPPVSSTHAHHWAYAAPGSPMAFARSRMSAHMSVRRSPGCSTFAVTPVPASSAARWRVMWLSAALLVW